MMKIFKQTILFLIILTSLLCNSQNKIDVKDYVEKTPIDFLHIKDSLSSYAINVVDYLPKGYSVNGDENYTEYIQIALDKSGVVMMPSFPVLIDYRGLNVRSNTKLLFNEESQVLMYPNSKTHYSLININDVENIEIYHPNLIGDRLNHKIGKGEWGMGINIIGSMNIHIFSPVIMDTWGDGIYIGAKGSKHSKNINIYNVYINNVRRNGISITSGEDILIKGGYIAYTNGTAPQSGVDIEPNKPTNVINNINIDGLVTHKNKGDGIMISLSPLTLKQNKMELDGRQSNITILNHTDVASFSAFRINGRLKSDKYSDVLLKGNINIVNPVWIDNETPIRFTPKPDRILEYGFYPKVSVENISIFNSNGTKIKQHENVKASILKEIEKL